MKFKKITKEDKRIFVEVEFEADEISELIIDKTGWELKRSVESGLTTKLVDRIMEEQGSALVKEITEGVDWSNLLRSKVVRKAVQEMRDDHGN